MPLKGRKRRNTIAEGRGTGSMGGAGFSFLPRKDRIKGTAGGGCTWDFFGKIDENPCAIFDAVVRSSLKNQIKSERI